MIEDKADKIIMENQFLEKLAGVTACLIMFYLLIVFPTMCSLGHAYGYQDPITFKWIFPSWHQTLENGIFLSIPIIIIIHLFLLGGYGIWRMYITEKYYGKIN